MVAWGNVASMQKSDAGSALSRSMLVLLMDTTTSTAITVMGSGKQKKKRCNGCSMDPTHDIVVLAVK